jgi:hypothetical protein
MVLALAAVVLIGGKLLACGNNSKPSGFTDGFDATMPQVDAGPALVPDADVGDAPADVALCPTNDCLPFHKDCNSDAGDGCEANVRLDPNNCGNCGKSCYIDIDGSAGAPPFSTPACVNGGCQYICIDDLFYGPMRNCKGSDPSLGDPIAGCPDQLLCDPLNCGACGVQAPVDSTGDRICMDGNPLPGCPKGMTNCHDGVCGQQCHDLNTDSANCGACGRKCPDESIPAATVLALKAKHIAFTCNGPNPDGGLPPCVPVCETDPPTSPFGPHIYVDCDGDFNQTVADPSNPAYNGCELESYHNKDHCGECNKACQIVCHTKKGTLLDQVCDCPAGLTWCPSIQDCVDLSNDARNCNACDRVCPGPAGHDDHGKPVCVGGVCGYKCRAGYADCNKKIEDGCEVDTQNFHDDCGQCGYPCQVDQRCGNGVCQTVQCSGPK